MNRKGDTAFGGSDDNCKKVVKKIRVNWEVCTGDDKSFDFGKSTSDVVDQECGDQECGCVKGIVDGDGVMVCVTDSDLLDQECGDGVMVCVTDSDLLDQERCVKGIVDCDRVIVIARGVDGSPGSGDDDGGMQIGVGGDNQQVDDDVLMVNSGNNTTPGGETTDEEQVVGPNQQVTTTSSFNFSQAFSIGFHVFTNKILNLIAGDLSPSEVLAIVNMLKALLPLVVMLFARIIQVTSGWIFRPNVVEEPIESYQLVSEPNHVMFAFLLNGVTDINHANFFIQDNHRLIVKAIKVISRRLIPFRTSVNLPIGNFALATTEKTFDKNSGLLTISIKNFI